MAIFTLGIVVFSIVLLTSQVKRQKISMRTLVWPYLMLFAMFVIVYPPILRFLTHTLGFSNTENLVFFIISGYLFVITIVQEVRIAKLSDKVNDLARQIAINGKENDDSNSDD